MKSWSNHFADHVEQRRDNKRRRSIGFAPMFMTADGPVYGPQAVRLAHKDLETWK